MRVKVLSAFAYGYRVWNPGEEGEIPDETAVALLRSGDAQRLPSEPETAVPNRMMEKAVRSIRPVKMG